MRTERLDYVDGETVCEGFVAYDETTERRRPCVLVAHSWAGQSAAERAVATELARQGYVGFALDVYGTGVRGGLWDDNAGRGQRSGLASSSAA
jgi:dienelactone hydrolase